ncbi:Alpha-mannosidase 2x, partial [Coemansia sp. RSA 2599]
MYLIEQVADIDRLDGWTVGQGHVFWLLVLPTFIAAYMVSGTMRWTGRQTVLFICALAVGIVLIIFGLPDWQSRPLATASSSSVRGLEQTRQHGWSARKLMALETEHGALCDSASIWINHQTRVTYSLCADKPSLVQITTSLGVDVNREVVAQFEIEQPKSLGERLFGCEFDIFNGVDVVRRRYSRWTPIPGNYYPATSHVSLASAGGRGDRRHRGFTLHSRQAMGVTCIRPNTIETMLHRSMSGNDFRGLRDPMVDDVPATITQFLDLGSGRADKKLELLENVSLNTPPLAFALPINRARPLSYFAGVNPDTRLSAGSKALSLVGLHVSDTDLLGIKDGSAGGSNSTAKLYVRLQALPSTAEPKPVSIRAADLISNSGGGTGDSHGRRKGPLAYAVEGGDWSIAPASTRKRTLRQ